jgi:selenium metabolism protein YedF
MTFLYLNSDGMGDGEPELGRKLMEIFLEQIAESDISIDFVGCVNSGINLTTEGSPVLESLRRLEDRGARIATCSTCLKYHGVEEKLAIGGTGKMEDTVRLMAAADRIIRPN